MRVAHSEGVCRSCTLQLHDSWRQTKQIVPLLLILIAGWAGGWADAAVVDGLMQPPPAAAAAAPATAPAAADAAAAAAAAAAAFAFAANAPAACS